MLQDADSSFYPYPQPFAYRHLYPIADFHPNGYQITDAHPDPHVDPHADPYTDRYTHPYLYPDPDARLLRDHRQRREGE